ncbi:hypothetical protein VCUG_02050 [Vavraia culicis subsp. floridensis]|uniref:Uncharacterized protein n=1 Tax=Vavraia culicis (isolate floridensis) TaxID=948595 RepID=L2GTP0_VAVCU|nr:uncharacterized protein VCUG_02050 [Vavraia culicis subsp. floridensis]ELA46455.1 hypothetical protein VCUG_02050 [Vavraia culicis subsp. floridensis]
MFIPVLFLTGLLTVTCYSANEAAIEEASLTTERGHAEEHGTEEDDQSAIENDVCVEDKCSGLMPCSDFNNCDPQDYAYEDDDASSTGEMYVIDYDTDELFNGDAEFDMNGFMSEIRSFPFKTIAAERKRKEESTSELDSKQNDEAKKDEDENVEDEKDVEPKNVEDEKDVEPKKDEDEKNDVEPKNDEDEKDVEPKKDEDEKNDVEPKKDEDEKNDVEPKNDEDAAASEKAQESDSQLEKVQELEKKPETTIESGELQSADETKPMPKHDDEPASTEQSKAVSEESPELEANPAPETQEKHLDRHAVPNAESLASGGDNVVRSNPAVSEEAVPANAENAKLVITPKLENEVEMALYYGSEDIKEFCERLAKKDRKYAEKARALLNTFLKGLEALESEAVQNVV